MTVCAKVRAPNSAEEVRQRLQLIRAVFLRVPRATLQALLDHEEFHFQHSSRHRVR